MKRAAVALSPTWLRVESKTIKIRPENLQNTTSIMNNLSKMRLYRHHLTIRARMDLR